MRVLTIIQARMGSTRLPGKVARRVGGRTVLAWVVYRTRLARLAGEIVVATSELPRDDAVEAMCSEIGVPCFRGSELDVLDRFYQAARSRDADTVVRVTADCPLLDPALLDTIVETHVRERADYVSVEGAPLGVAQESLSATALEQSWRQAKLPDEREHVILYVTERPDEFKVLLLPAPPPLNLPSWRFTIDTERDVELLDGLFETTKGRLFDLAEAEIVDAVARSPRLLALATREP